jgi:hypothetical protein
MARQHETPMRADPEKFAEMLATLDREGWDQGGDSNGPPCLVQSGWRQLNGFSDYRAFVDSSESVLLMDVIYEQFPDRLFRGPTARTACCKFNDHPDTTEADIRAVIEKARTRAEEQP